MPMANRLAAEMFGTFRLTFAGCGSAVLAAAFPEVGIGLLGVSFAFGLSLLTMAYTIGHISGCHINPAVSVGLAAGGRFPAAEVVPYAIAQVIGGILGAGVLYLIASGKPGFELGGFASNGFGEHSPGGYAFGAAFLCEVVMTFMFLTVILGSTDGRAPTGFAGLPIGLALVLIHLVHSGHQHVGEPGTQHRSGALRGRLGHPAAVAVLAGADHRRRARGLELPVARRRGRPQVVRRTRAGGRATPRPGAAEVGIPRA